MMGKNVRAFTLIELLVVVLIIGILAAVAVPQYQRAVMSSRYARLKLLVRSIGNAQELYFLSNGEYAANAEEVFDISWGGTLNKNNNEYILFDWGYCWIRNRFTNCWYNKSQPSPQLYYKHSDNKVQCYAWSDDPDSLANKFCQQETGATTPSSKNKENWGWTYLKERWRP